jgi:hypothetical protein
MVKTAGRGEEISGIAPGHQVQGQRAAIKALRLGQFAYIENRNEGGPGWFRAAPDQMPEWVAFAREARGIRSCNRKGRTPVMSSRVSTVCLVSFEK